MWVEFCRGLDKSAQGLMSLFPLFQQTFPWEGRCAPRQVHGSPTQSLSRRTAPLPQIGSTLSHFKNSQRTARPPSLPSRKSPFLNQRGGSAASRTVCGWSFSRGLAESALNLMTSPLLVYRLSAGLHFDRGAPAESSGTGMALILDMKPKFLPWQVRLVGGFSNTMICFRTSVMAIS